MFKTSMLVVIAFLSAASAHAADQEYLLQISPQLSVAQVTKIMKITQRISSRPVRRIRSDVFAVRVSKKQLLRLKSESAVLHIERNSKIKLLAIPNDLNAEQWALSSSAGFDLNAPKAWAITTGSKDIVVAVIDTGMDMAHEDLRDNLWTNKIELNGKTGVDDDNNGYIDDIHGYNFALNTPDPQDTRGHGTHVSGIIGAVGANGRGIVGMNWNVSLMPLNMFPNYSDAQISDAIRAIDYAVANGARVINASWVQAASESEPEPSRLLREAIARAGTAGVTFVAAAGNSATDNDTVPTIPATYGLPNIISVGSMNREGGRSDFSNFGLKTVDVVAPGSDILSTLPGDYGYKSGTSMAAPYVTGLVALMLSVKADASPATIKDFIVKSCTPNAKLTASSVCKGHVDAGRALEGLLGK